MSERGDEVLPTGVRELVERRLPGFRIDAVSAVDGGSQASVWRATMLGAHPLDLAVRLVRRPLDLLLRQAAAIDRAHGAGAPVNRMLLTELYDTAPGSACVQVMHWVRGAHPRAAEDGHARAVGKALAVLHGALGGLEQSFPDRPLKLDTFCGYVCQLRSAGNGAGTILGAVERHQKPLRDWDDYYGVRLPRQLIHGDMHWGNVVVDGPGAHFIDFDKMMVGPRIFDLAKFISTSCFLEGREVRLARRSVSELLEGYSTVSPLLEVEMAGLVPLCLILNTENALCGLSMRSPNLVRRARRLGGWWALKSGRGPIANPRRTRRPPIRSQQLVLFGGSVQQSPP